MKISTKAGGLAGWKKETEEEGKYDTNVVPIVISFSLNCTFRRNALKNFFRFIVKPAAREKRKEIKFDMKFFVMWRRSGDWSEV